MVRSKTSRGEVKDYCTFLGQDSKLLLRQWIRTRPKVNLPELFVTFRKVDRTWVPVRPEQVGSTVTDTAMRATLIAKGPYGLANRYRVHAHEFRDLVKSVCDLNGVEVASEWFLGHDIDRLGYKKSPWYDAEFFRNEYKKVEPILNLFHQLLQFEEANHPGGFAQLASLRTEKRSPSGWPAFPCFRWSGSSLS